MPAGAGPVRVWGAHREATFSLSGVAGEGEEDVVEVGGVHATARRPRWPGSSSRSSSAFSERRLPSLGTRRASASSSRDDLARARARPRRGRAGRRTAARTWPPGMRRLSSSGGALGDHPAVVEHRDPVGQLVGLLQVLGGQEDGDAAGHQVPDDLPHVAAAARVQPGGRLVEEDHLAGCRPGSSPGRAGAACRRSRSTPASRPRRPGRTGRAARRRGAGPSARPRWCRSAISSRFSSPVSRLSTAENWPVTPIAARTASGSLARSWPATRTSPASARISVDRILTVVVLPGAVRAEQREDRSPRDVQVDAVEHDVVAERLAQPGRRDRRLGLLRGHGVPSPRVEWSGAADGDVAEGGARAHLDGLVGLLRAGWRSSSRLRTCPNPVFTSSHAAVPSAMPTSRSPVAVPSATEPRATSPRRMLPLEVLASTPGAGPVDGDVAVGRAHPHVAGDRVDRRCRRWSS